MAYDRLALNRRRDSPKELSKAENLPKPQALVVEHMEEVEPLSVRALGLSDYGDYEDAILDKLSSKHGYGHHSGYGHGHHGSDYGHAVHYHDDHKECCPLVVDPLALISILGLLLGGTAFLNVAITMNITMRRRRKKRSSPNVVSSSSDLADAFHSGRTVRDTFSS